MSTTGSVLEARINPRKFWSEAQIMNYQTPLTVSRKEVPQNMLIVDHVEVISRLPSVPHMSKHNHIFILPCL